MCKGMMVAVVVYIYPCYYSNTIFDLQALKGNWDALAFNPGC